MKILEIGKLKSKKIKKTCKECGTKFAYTKSDIEWDSTDGSTYLYCPHCKSFILITSAKYTLSVDRSTDC